MAGNLVIVESPAKAGTIQKFLGDDFSVKSSFGHVRDLPDREESIDIKNGFEPKYEIPAEKRRLVEDLKKAAKKADTVWLASDEDREGEAISWHLSEVLELDMAKTKRIVFHEITKPVVLNAIQNPRTIDMDLVYAQQARRVLDRIVGYELSPLLWRKIQPRLSAGRVQSVVLRLVVEREREIINFNSEAYYRIEALFRIGGQEDGKTISALLNKRFATIDEARAFLESCKGASFCVSKLEQKEGVRYPAAPFTTATLQQEASRKLRMSVSRTMQVAQHLYEKGLITYMRTDSTNLSTLAIGTAKQYILGAYGEEYLKVRQFKTNDKSAQEAHEAIRPTYVDRAVIEGTNEEKKLYDLIWKRTVASQMTDAKVLRTDVSISNDRNDGIFNVQASQVLFDGFLKLYMEGRDDEQEDDEIILPELHVGEKMDALSIAAECKFTAAPPRYSEATIIKEMKDRGIGRPSTYAPTITTLMKSYITKGNKEGEKKQVQNLTLKGNSITSSKKTETIGAEKGKIFPQEIGIRVTDYLVENFSDILDYDFTANLEMDFDEIAKGERTWKDVISAFYGQFNGSVKSALESTDYTRVEREIGTAPDGQMLIAKLGKFGPYVQKGDGDNRLCASMAPGQLIESISLEEALALFTLPRTVGQLDGVDIIATKGRYGAYLKYGDKNITLPKGKAAETVSYTECCDLIQAADKRPEPAILAEFGSIQVINGAYGPYLKYDGKNYRLPKGTDAGSLDEEACRKIINETEPTAKGKGRKSFRRR
ncbi:MAG: type I DNA topoisomerase [Bacteroidales bacterium]|nr:type I DNA topoisomerase [Bacteroidales bacterium]